MLNLGKAQRYTNRKLLRVCNRDRLSPGALSAWHLRGLWANLRAKMPPIINQIRCCVYIYIYIATCKLNVTTTFLHNMWRGGGPQSVCCCCSHVACLLQRNKFRNPGTASSKFPKELSRETVANLQNHVSIVNDPSDKKAIEEHVTA